MIVGHLKKELNSFGAEAIKNMAYKNLSSVGDKIFYVRKDAQEIISKIRHKSDFSVLDNMPTEAIQLCFEGKETNTVVVTKDIVYGVLSVTFLDIDQKGYVGYTNVNIDLHNWDYTNPTQDTDPVATQNNRRVFEKLIYPTLMYLYFSDVEIVKLAPVTQVTKNNIRTMNDTLNPVRVVTAKWNTISSRTEGFGVSGHFAVRRYGEGRKRVKIVWIAPYKKSGYTRTNKRID
jgi:hypothetical protein